MKKLSLQVSMVFLMLATAACGPFQAEQAATGTKIAADIFATQTAQAPTATATFTPSPTATVTPTVTPVPTDTPTSIPSPTPLPAWISAGLVLEDLPAGFRAMSDQDLSALKQGLPQNSIVFGYSHEASSQAVMGYLISYPAQAEQAAFDGMLPDMLELFATAYGATTEPEIITGLNDLGESRAGSTFVSGGGEIDLRWENILFRRGEIGVILFVLYPDGEEPAVPGGDLARLLDGRLAQAVYPQTESWMAMWTYDPPPGFLSKGLHNYHFEWMYTLPSLASKNSDPLQIDISSTTGSKETPLRDGYVLVQTWAAMPQQAWTGSGCEVVAVVNPKQPLRFVWGWVNDDPMNYEQALAHFKSFKVEVFWDGPSPGSATLVMGNLMPFEGKEARWEYVCTLTGHPQR